MAELNTEDPPAVPPRQHTVVPMEDPGPRVREFFENSLEKVHDSLERKITEYHTAVERAVCNSSPYIQVDNAQASSSSGVSMRQTRFFYTRKADRTADTSHGPVVAAGTQRGEIPPRVSRESCRRG